MSTQISTYKDYPIQVDVLGRFMTDRFTGSFDTYAELIAAIDKHRKIKWVRQPGFLLFGRFDRSELQLRVHEVEATAVHELNDDPKRTVLWVTHKGNGKRRETRAAVYQDTPENRVIAEKVLEVRRELKRLAAVESDLESTLSIIVLEQEQVK